MDFMMQYIFWKVWTKAFLWSVLEVSWPGYDQKLSPKTFPKNGKKKENWIWKQKFPSLWLFAVGGYLNEGQLLKGGAQG